MIPELVGYPYKNEDDHNLPIRIQTRLELLRGEIMQLRMIIRVQGENFHATKLERDALLVDQARQGKHAANLENQVEANIQEIMSLKERLKELSISKV